MKDTVEKVDCVIIGAGPAGLSAAIYLARFRRSVRLIDAGNSRAALIPLSHNYPGFPEGISGPELLQRLPEQAGHFGVHVIHDTVERLEKQEDGNFLSHCSQGNVRSQMVLLATGLKDIEPQIPAIRQAIADGLVRYCPICDGYEAGGKRVAVIGHGEKCFKEALFIRHFTNDLTIITLDEDLHLSEAERETLAEQGIRLVRGPIARIHQTAKNISVRCLQDSQTHDFDTVYSMLGTRVHSEMAQALRAQDDEDGNLLVDDHLQTSVSGLYAAGDVVNGLNQIAVATGQAAIAATAIHNRL